MSGPTSGQRTHRITDGARFFALLAIGAPVLYTRDRIALVALAGIAGAWLLSGLAQRRSRLAPYLPVAEAALTGALCGMTIDSSQTVLLTLAVPPFVAAVVRGVYGVLLATCAALATVVAFALLVQQGLTAEQALSIFTWTVTGIGLGLIGSFVHSGLQAEVDELAPYLDAQLLIRQLLDLSDDLRSGLDVLTLAGSLVSDIGDRLPVAAIALYVPRGEVLVPLIARSADDLQTLEEAEELAVESWARSGPIMHENTFAFPIGDSTIAAGRLSGSTNLDLTDVERAILRLPTQLRAKSVQLDTAVLFSDFRDAASADVRKRLAREMHDGVAQDIASLGYLVDALAARPADEKQAKALAMMRDRITKIVAEVRQSVLTLRTSIGESESLGAAISTVARHLSESSRIPIQVTLDEHSTRLRPEVEAELFRIAQEAMNNAIKHAECTAIEVNCQVHAPSALITVADDGRGLQKGRTDSHGLKIMRERARLVGAELSIDEQPAGGLMVTVQIGHGS